MQIEQLGCVIAYAATNIPTAKVFPNRRLSQSMASDPDRTRSELAASPDGTLGCSGRGGGAEFALDAKAEAALAEAARSAKEALHKASVASPVHSARAVDVDGQWRW